MADQYIYARAAGSGRGSGFVCRTPGIVGAVQRSILSMASYEQADSADLFRGAILTDKQTLPDRPDKVLVRRRCAANANGSRIAVSHGYVFDSTDPILSDPNLWQNLTWLPAGGADTLPAVEDLAEPSLAKTVPMPLKQVLSRFGFDEESLRGLLLSCIRREEKHSLILVAADSGKLDEASSAGLLWWICAFLPPALRRELDMTTSFRRRISDHSMVGLIPVERLENRGGSPVPPGEAAFYQGANLLLLPANRNTPDGSDDGFFSRWLEEKIRSVLQEENTDAALENLKQEYARIDRMILSLPRRDRCRLCYYDALCWAFGRSTREDTAADRRELQCFEDLLAFGSWDEVIDTVGSVLNLLPGVYSAPAAGKLIRLMTRVLLLDGAGTCRNQARDMMSAFLSCDMECVEIGESSSVSARYLRVMQANGMERGDAAELLERAFFPGDYEGNDDLWNLLGTSRSPEEGIRRCSDWLSGYVNVCLNTDELIGCVETVMLELEGFEPGHLQKVLDCLVASQENRRCFARLEILPGHLAECCRLISGARQRFEGPCQAIAEEAYTHLLMVLSQGYLSYWQGKYTLNAICSLNDAFREVGWSNSRTGYLRELVLAQSYGICQYNWESLKKQLSQEDSGILNRLWQVLDLLTEYKAEPDMMDGLCRQVCRYILHAVPEYAGDQWISDNVRDRDGLKKEGYYLELLALRDFLRGEEQSMEQLQFVIKSLRVGEPQMRDMMKFLYRAFSQGGLPNLKIAAVEGIYLAGRQRLKVSQADVFRTVARVRGGEALIELLENWPSAPVDEGLTGFHRKRVEAVRRESSYSWLKNGTALIEALTELSRDREVLTAASSGRESFFLDLMESVDALVPQGTQGRGAAVAINRNLLGLQEEQGSLKMKFRCSTKKHRLLAE